MNVSIIYNPKSTGDSRAGAKELEKKLKKILPKIPIKCVPTKYAGHSEKLACAIASSRKKPLIVSASGDGGYHEVVNGVMRASARANGPICAVLPTGNANDHSRTMQDKPLWQAIDKGKVTKIDLLKISMTNSSGSTAVRYAHSYIGLGLTPVIAAELNRHDLTAFKETMLVLKTFFKHRPFKIRRKSKVFKLDSLVFTNINQMAKILTLAEKNRPADGRFEVVSFPHAHRLVLIKKILLAATTGLKTSKRERTYEFEVIKKMPIQLDGELAVLEAGAKVQIITANKALTTIV